jgi:hypothetical protein
MVRILTMQYEFLKQFPKRMKHVGMYALVLQNSSQKQTWKQYGFLKTDEQINIIFALMLYIMEQSLKEEKCTMDDMGAYLDYLNMTYFNTGMSFDDCRKLGDFIINVILSNEGKAMYFDGYDFEQRAYKIMNISYVSNEIVYLDSDVKRTSYRLTEDGYNLLLSTLEIENNMKLTIHEMIFKMHLEKQSYDKAVDEIKNVFNLLRIQLQKIQDAMLRVRRNALSYSVSDYEQLLGENMESIDMTKQKFQSYRETVRKRAKELEEQNINVRKLSAQEEENLENLRIIESYLNRGIDEHQKILNSHFDLKILYEKELELLSQMSLIQRFSLRTDLYDKVLQDASGLDNIDIFLRPLFHQAPDKIYNLQKATQLQRPIRKKQQEEEEEVLDFDEDQWQEEYAARKRKRLMQYENSLGFVLDKMMEKGKITLQEMASSLGREEQNTLIPDIDIFKEIMVELIKSRHIDIDALHKEKSEYIAEETLDFQLNEMILELVDKDERRKHIHQIDIYRLEDGGVVEFRNIRNETGDGKTVRCSNVALEIGE